MLFVVSFSIQESRDSLPDELLIFGSPEGAKAGAAIGVIPIILPVDVFLAQLAAKIVMATSEIVIKYL